jgi:hypothetical protein
VGSFPCSHYNYNYNYKLQLSDLLADVGDVGLYSVMASNKGKAPSGARGEVKNGLQDAQTPWGLLPRYLHMPLKPCLPVVELQA